MSDTLELITLLETVRTQNSTARQEIDRCLDTLEQGTAQEVSHTLWDTVLGCNTDSAIAVDGLDTPKGEDFATVALRVAETVE